VCVYCVAVEVYARCALCTHVRAKLTVLTSSLFAGLQFQRIEQLSAFTLAGVLLLSPSRAVELAHIVIVVALNLSPDCGNTVLRGGDVITRGRRVCMMTLRRRQMAALPTIGCVCGLPDLLGRLMRLSCDSQVVDHIRKTDRFFSNTQCISITISNI